MSIGKHWSMFLFWLNAFAYILTEGLYIPGKPGNAILPTGRLGATLGCLKSSGEGTGPRGAGGGGGGSSSGIRAGALSYWGSRFVIGVFCFKEKDISKEIGYYGFDKTSLHKYIYVSIWVK